MLHERSNITAPSTEHLTFPEKITFVEVFWVRRGKKKKKNKGTIHFQSAKYRVPHKRSTKAAPFVEHLKFQEQTTFTNTFRVNSG